MEYAYFNNILAFCVLMFGSDVLRYEPRYLVGKFNLYFPIVPKPIDDPMIDGGRTIRGLDDFNRSIFMEYSHRWLNANNLLYKLKEQ